MCMGRGMQRKIEIEKEKEKTKYVIICIVHCKL